MKLKYAIYSKMHKSGKNNNEKLKTNSKIINSGCIYNYIK